MTRCAVDAKFGVGYEESLTQPLWVTTLMAGDSTPGRPRDALGAELRVIADWIEERASRSLDLDPWEVADSLRNEASIAEGEG